MKKKLHAIKRELKSLDYRHLICISITLAFVCLTIFFFPYSIGRFAESCRDFGRSLGFLYITKLFQVGDITPSVNALTKMPLAATYGFPATWEEFKAVFVGYWQAFAKKEYFLEYMLSTTKGLLIGTIWLSVLILPVIILIVLFVSILKKPNNNYNRDTKPLTIFKRISDYTYQPVKNWILGFKDFVLEHKNYVYIWAFIWLFAFNIFAIAIEALAYLFYFDATGDFANLYRQVYKLGYDLLPMFSFVPIIVWVIIGLLIFDKWRKDKGFDELNHMELKNRGFINERSIVYMLVGPMGACKTALSTVMALSQEIMYRDQALEGILECDSKFPYFPWINLENMLRHAIERHVVYNLQTARSFVLQLKRQYRRRPESFNLFGYDYKRYGIAFDDALTINTLWDTVFVYAQLYLLYVLRSSLIISNYAIRSDNVMLDLGNFPLWDTDFFNRHPDLRGSRYSHILDFDILKLGLKLVADNENSNCFEFGVIVITEIGKERGNMLDEKKIRDELKKNSNIACQLNDHFNRMLKMIRHAGTIDHKCYSRLICDEQRPESIGADARELAEIVHIDEVSEMRLAMPCFEVEELIHSFIYSRFKKLYLKYRFLRGDNSLFVYITKSIVMALHRYYVRIYNQFGYKKIDLSVEAGTQDGKLKERNYYLMSKVAYSKRYATDCFSDFFAKRVKRSNIGIDDMPTYLSEIARFKEMDKTNSYFFRDLCKLLNQGEQKNDN